MMLKRTAVEEVFIAWGGLDGPLFMDGVASMPSDHRRNV